MVTRGDNVVIVSFLDNSFPFLSLHILDWQVAEYNTPLMHLHEQSLQSFLHLNSIKFLLLLHIPWLPISRT